MTYNAIDIPRQEKSNHPFAMFYVYPREFSPFILKGKSEDCRQMIENYKLPCFYRYTYWKNGISRGGWITNIPMYITKHSGNGYDITVFRSGKPVKIHFRRMPHMWVPEIEQLYQLIVGKI
jgi:hypothetical protein